MENGEWRIFKNTPTRMDFNSQLSILNSQFISNPSPCWLLHGTAVRRPHTRSYHRKSRTLRRGSVVAQHSTTLIQLGGCFPSITHKDLTSINGGRFIRSNWIVAFPTSVSPTMRQGNRMSVGIGLSIALSEAQSSPNSGEMEFHWTFATELGHGIYAGL